MWELVGNSGLAAPVGQRMGRPLYMCELMQRGLVADVREVVTWLIG